jgi:hypothetical protein
MKPSIIAGALFLLWVGALEAQQPNITPFAAAYDAVKADLPSGPHVVVLSDPLLRKSRTVPTPNGGWAPAPPEPWNEADVQRGNREFARGRGLTLAPLADARVCGLGERPDDCTFARDDIAATVSFRLVSAAADSGLVEVATRYFIPTPTMNWEVLALYEVRLVRRGGAWVVVSAGARLHS